MKMLVVFVILLHVSQHASAVELYEGEEFVLLPCEFHTFEMDDPTVVWRRYDLNPSVVHQRHREADELEDQNQLYSGRTSMTPDALESGDLSLHLTKLRLSDSGTYICTVSDRGQLTVRDVQVQVKERFPSWATVLLVLLVVGLIVSGGLLVHFRHYFMPGYKVEVDSEVESVQLPCKTTVHLPEDVSVKWRNGDNRRVHVYKDTSDQPEEQFCYYTGRTAMKRNLKTGDVSLTLKYPTDTDTGKYTCIVSREGKTLMEKQVTLQVKGCQVEVDEGVNFVQLPFKTAGNLPGDTEVEWKHFRNYIMKVHVYQKGSDRPGEQDEAYRGRTEMKEDMLRTGDVSLTLKSPKRTDTGRYVCIVHNRERNIWREKTVMLTVKELMCETTETVMTEQVNYLQRIHKAASSGSFDLTQTRSPLYSDLLLK